MDNFINKNNQSGKSLYRPKVSVIICTYNRADLLNDVIKTLCTQTLDTSEYEIIVVDNNSNDHTRIIVEQFIPQYANIRYCFEPKQGLSHARNCGWQSASADFVAYVDDDCKVPEHWLEVATEVIEQVFPGAFGGPFFPFYKTPKPLWFKDSYRTHIHDQKARVLRDGEYLSGMNMFFRKELLQKLGGFNPNLGMSGKKIAYGEETDMIKLIRKKMPEEIIYYHPRLYVYHMVRPEEMTMNRIIRQYVAHGCYGYHIFHKERFIKRGKALFVLLLFYRILIFSWHLTIGLLIRDRKKYPYFQNYFYERTLPQLHVLSVFYEHAVETLHNKKGNN